MRGAFSLTDTTALTITGTLNAAGQTVTLNDTGGGIDAHAGVIDAAMLTGSANGDALFSDGANKIGTFANFTDDAGSVSLSDSIFLTITGTIDPTTLTLVDTGGGIDSSGAAIIAGTLTGSTNGVATFTNAGNDIGTLNNYTNTQGAFSLTDSVALKITGTLNATGQTVTLVDTGGGINASQGVIEAATLTGSTKGAATFTDAANAIGTLNGFETNGNAFSLTDSTALAMTATLDAAGQTVTLVDTGGAHRRQPRRDQRGDADRFDGGQRDLHGQQHDRRARCLPGGRLSQPDRRGSARHQRRGHLGPRLHGCERRQRRPRTI